MINATTQTPILSHGHRIRGHSDEFRASIPEFARRITSEGEDVTRFQVFQKTLFFTRSPKLLQEILVDKARYFQKSIGMRLLLYPLAGEGLFTSNGDLWRRQRKTMAPIFQHNKLSHFTHIMSSMAEREVSTWKNNETLDISKEMTRVTMGIVGKALFDADTFTESDELGAALTTALHWGNSQALSVPLVSKIITLSAMETLAPRVPERLRDVYQRTFQALHFPLLPNKKNKELAEAKAVLTRRMQQMIDDRKQSGLTKKDLLTTLLSARDEDGNPMSDQQVQDEAITLFVAGHETTATALMWVFYLLSQHPDIYQKLLAEIDAFWKETPGDQVNFEDLVKLPYTLQVFQEAMRLYPPVPMLSRQTTQEIQVGEYLFPAKSIIFFSPWSIHRDPSLWVEPDRFNPDRFLPGEQEKRPRFSYLPFGGGPRVCIGNHFAMMEAQILLACFSRHATLTLAPNFTPIPHSEPTLRSQNGMKMIVSLR
jgi:cytochrome P450